MWEYLIGGFFLVWGAFLGISSILLVSGMLRKMNRIICRGESDLSALQAVRHQSGGGGIKAKKKGKMVVIKGPLTGPN